MIKDKILIITILLLLTLCQQLLAQSNHSLQNTDPIANFSLNEDDTTRYSHHHLRAQESCYEQYFREHNKKILTAEDADDSYDELKKTVLAKQMYGDSYLLMVDTIAQRTVITKVDGTYIADVHVVLVDSTCYMWLSVDPLADKNIANTPYMYCNGNPIRFVDPDGRSAVVGDDGEVLGVIENNDHFIYYATKDWTAQQGTDNFEKVGLMIGNNDFYQKLKSEKLPCFGLFYTKASLSAQMSVGIQCGRKFDDGLFRRFTLTGNLVSVELLSAGYSLSDGADFNYIGKNDMYNISQELSLGLIFGAGIGQNFTTKGYGYESQETWAKFLGTYKHDGITQQQTGSFDINLSVSAIIGASLNMCIPFTYKR